VGGLAKLVRLIRLVRLVGLVGILLFQRPTLLSLELK
jgi:hypothetical protein